MHARGPLVRFLLGLGLAGAAVVAVVGGIALRAPGLVAVCVSGALAACVAAGVAREAAGPGRRSTVESAVLAAAVTIGFLLVVSGTAVIAGGAAALLLAGTLAAGWVGVRWLRDRGGAADAVARAWPQETTAWPSPSVGTMSTTALGEEWRRTGAVLGGPLAPAARQRIVLRRAQVLDELERRDPAGFARWLAAGPVRGADPAGFLRSEPPRTAPGAEAA